MCCNCKADSSLDLVSRKCNWLCRLGHAQNNELSLFSNQQKFFLVQNGNLIGFPLLDSILSSHVSQEPLFSLTKKPRCAFAHFFKARVFGLSKPYWPYKSLEVPIRLFITLLGLFRPLYASPLLVLARSSFTPLSLSATLED